MSKSRRQKEILSLVQSDQISSQLELSRRLRARGTNVTQATLSRDLRELNLVKTAQGYKLAESLNRSNGSHHHLHQVLSQLMTEVAAASNLVVVKTFPGNAPSVALSLDHLGWKDIVGTVAGDDTILVVTRDIAKARAVKRRLMELRSP